MIMESDSLAMGIAELFGEQAQLVAPRAVEIISEAGVLTSHPIYHLLCIVLLAFWALLIYSYHSELLVLLQGAVMTQNLSSEETNPIFASLMRWTRLLAIFVGVLLVVRIVEREFVPLPEWLVQFNISFVVGLFLAGVLLFLLQNSVLRVIGLVCGERDFTHEAITLRGVCIGFWGFLVALPTLLLLLNHTATEEVVLHLITILTILALLLYMFKSFLLFRRAKISILIWFLYLCTVEALPVSLLVVGIARQL